VSRLCSSPRGRSLAEELTGLGELVQADALSPAEFEQAKARLLSKAGLEFDRCRPAPLGAWPSRGVDHLPVLAGGLPRLPPPCCPTTVPSSGGHLPNLVGGTLA
jgi:hypothetical protein